MLSDAERAPLLVPVSLQHQRDCSQTLSYDPVYDRFTPLKRRFITSIVSLAAITTTFATGSFIPAIPQIAEDLNTTDETVNYTVGAYILLIAVGNLFWAPYAEFYGRKPVYLSCLPVFALGSIITACAKSVLTLVIGRCIQSFGVSCLQGVGVASISDIYPLEVRGTGMGIFFAGLLLGLPFAPIIGGVLATYTSWRVMQLLLAAMGFAITAIVLIYLPETSHPGVRGLDKLIAEEEIARSTESNDEDIAKVAGHKTWRWVWLSPFSPLTLLRSPVICLLVLSSSFAFMTHYALIVPIATTLGEAYGLKTSMSIGLCFLPAGAGNTAGAAIGGKIADIFIASGKRKRHGIWYPEDRLKATLPGSLILIPFSLIIFAFTIAYVPGKTGLIICLICLFVESMGLDSILTPSATYLVDIVRHRGVEAMAVSGTFRHVFSAVSSAAILPIINSTSVVTASSIMAVCAWIAFGLLVTLIMNGNRLRDYVDVGYTTK